MADKIILEKGLTVECPTQKQFESWLEANGFTKIEESETEYFNSWCLGMTEILVFKEGKSSDMWIAQKSWEAIDDITFSTVNPIKSRKTIYAEIMLYPKE